MPSCSANATSVAACTGSRSAEPTMVSFQSRSNSRASARSSKSCPLRGTSAPIERMQHALPPEPVLRGASSVPGTTTLMRSRSTPKSANEPFGGRLTGHDDARESGQQPLLNSEQRGAVGLVEARFQRGRMMDQTDGIAHRQRIVQPDERRQGEPVDDPARTTGDAFPRCPCRRTRRSRPPADTCPRAPQHAPCGRPRAAPRPRADRRHNRQTAVSNGAGTISVTCIR